MKSFKPVLPKVFFFFKLLMCFTLFKNHKIPIINSSVAIETMESVKPFLRNFLFTFFECSRGNLKYVRNYISVNFNVTSDLHFCLCNGFPLVYGTKRYVPKSLQYTLPLLKWREFFKESFLLTFLLVDSHYNKPLFEFSFDGCNYL